MTRNSVIICKLFYYDYELLLQISHKLFRLCVLTVRAALRSPGNTPIWARIVQLGNGITVITIEQGLVTCILVIRKHCLLNYNRITIKSWTTISYGIFFSCSQTHQFDCNTFQDDFHKQSLTESASRCHVIHSPTPTHYHTLKDNTCKSICY